MVKLKLVANWFLQIGISIVLISFLLIAPITIMPSLLSAQSNINRVDDFKYKGILELWHIETFEGGGASRANFLQQQAMKFEKQNKGVYIVVNTISIEQLKLNLQNNKFPNMLSFGIGVGDEITNHLCSFDFEIGARDDILKGGMFNGSQLAIPYILGGYALISLDQGGQVGTGFVGANNSLKTAAKNNLKLNLFNRLDNDTYNAYDKFVKGSYNSLLGTQRDVYRVKNRIDKGLMTDVKFNFLSGYSDLVQYISVFNSKNTEEEICKKFAIQLVSDSTQLALKNINMFSVLNNTSLYTDEIFGKMEKALLEPLEVENVFLNNDKILEEKQICLGLVKQ